MTIGTATAVSACDRCALLVLYAEYNRALDAGNAAAWADTFTDDGIFEHPSAHFVGRIELERFVRQRTTKLDSHPCSHQRHWNDAIEFRADGVRANGSCCLLVSGIRRETNHPEVVATGRYTDELVKRDNGWRFRRRRLQVD